MPPDSNFWFPSHYIPLRPTPSHWGDSALVEGGVDSSKQRAGLPFCIGIIEQLYA